MPVNHSITLTERSTLIQNYQESQDYDQINYCYFFADQVKSFLNQTGVTKLYVEKGVDANNKEVFILTVRNGSDAIVGNSSLERGYGCPPYCL